MIKKNSPNKMCLPMPGSIIDVCHRSVNANSPSPAVRCCCTTHQVCVFIFIIFYY
ncbi:hypothetical protein Hanom_Chr06g00578941 [Helianthus anomalus]